MARKQETREIEGVGFRVVQLPFGKARSVFLRLAKTMGPVLGAIPTKKGAPFPIMEALAAAVADVSEADLVQLTADLATDCAYCLEGEHGKKWPMLTSNVETLFEGRLVLYFKWLAFACEVNFADFFAAFAVRPEPAHEGETPA